MNTHDILSFLGKAWSESKETQLEFSDWFKANVYHNIIYIPEYESKILKQIRGLSRWRVWRFTTFHEAMHLKLSPISKNEATIEIADDLDFGEVIIRGFEDKHISDRRKKEIIMNYISTIYEAIEDDRIERLGLKIYKGYQQEQEFTRRIMGMKYRNDWKLVLEQAQEKEAKMIYAFPGKLLFDLEPSMLEGEREFLEKIIGLARSVETQEEAQFITKEIIKRMMDRYDKFKDIKEIKVGMNMVLKGFDSSVSGDIKKLEKEIQPDEAIKGEFERIEEARFSENLVDAHKDVMLERMQSHKDGGVGRLRIKNPERKKESFRLMEGTKSVINRLISTLREWKVGWGEIRDYTGNSIDIDSYLLERHQKGRGKFFLREEQINPKTDIALLIDMSSSISHMEKDYMRAVAVMGEALNYVETRFSIFVFAPPYFWTVKLMNEPWGNDIIRRLAAIRAKGGTPLANAFELSQRFLSHEGFKQIVLITDGRPNDPERSADIISDLESRGIKISILGFLKNSNLEYTDFFKLIGHRSGRVKLIRQLAELPLALFDLLRA